MREGLAERCLPCDPKLTKRSKFGALESDILAPRAATTAHKAAHVELIARQEH